VAIFFQAKSKVSILFEIQSEIDKGCSAAAAAAAIPAVRCTVVSEDL
jgi:hypothetical protein